MPTTQKTIILKHQQQQLQLTKSCNNFCAIKEIIIMKKIILATTEWWENSDFFWITLLLSRISIYFLIQHFSIQNLKVKNSISNLLTFFFFVIFFNTHGKNDLIHDGDENCSIINNQSEAVEKNNNFLSNQRN